MHDPRGSKRGNTEAQQANTTKPKRRGDRWKKDERRERILT
jgi:hypothetical protein